MHTRTASPKDPVACPEPRFRARVRRVDAVVVAVLLAFGPGTLLEAQVPQPKLNAFAPLGLVRGGTQTLTVSGAELEEPRALRFSDPRIVAEPQGSGFTVRVPTNVPSGVVEACWVGRFGVSTPRRLWVGDGPEIVLPATNHSKASAFAVPATGAVNGRLEAGQVAWFRITGDPGGNRVVHVAAASLDSRAEPVLAAFDAAGRELARDRRRGLLVLSNAPAGDLWVSLHDLRFRGGDGFGYRLTQGAGAEASRRALDNLVLPLAAAGIPTPAAEPREVPPGTLVPIQPPVDLRGTFPRRGQVTGATFTARKGEVLWLELVSDRMGDATDPLVLVQRQTRAAGDKGGPAYADVLELAKLDANPGGVEYPCGSRDVAGRFEAPEYGTYRVMIRDQFAQSTTAPLHPWRLCVRTEPRGVSLLVLPMPLPRQVDNDRQIHGTAINLRRGETVALKVVAFRQDGFNGDVDVSATNLPPGLTASTTRLVAGQRSGTLLLTAAEGLTNGVHAVQVVGRCTVGSRVQESVAQAGAALWSVPDWDQERPLVRRTDAVLVGVVGGELAALQVTPATNVIEVVAGGKATLSFRVERRGEFTAGFKLKAAGRPELEKAKELDVAEKGTQATVELNLAETALPVGEHVVWYEGRAAGKYRNQPEAIDAAKAALKLAEDALARAPAGDKAALEKRKAEATDRVKAAEERAKPRDVFAAVVSRPCILRVVKGK